MNQIRIEWASEDDLQIVMSLIRELAAYENLSHEVIASEADLRHALFSDPPAAEALIARVEDEAVGFALFFHNFSTFRGGEVSISRTCSSSPNHVEKDMDVDSLLRSPA